MVYIKFKIKKLLKSSVYFIFNLESDFLCEDRQKKTPLSVTAGLTAPCDLFSHVSQAM